MKKFRIEGPLYWGNTYVVIGEDVIELSYQRDRNLYNFIIPSTDGIKKYYSEEIYHDKLQELVMAAACETIEEFLPLVPSLLNIQDWDKIIIRLRSNFSGRLISGTWIKANLFNSPESGDITVYPNNGVLDRYRDQFPVECDAIIVNRTIGYIYSRNYNPAKQQAVTVVGGNARTEGSQAVTVPAAFTGDQVQCYIAFQNASQSVLSNSQHVGGLIIT